MPDLEFLDASGEGLWATDATDRVVFVHAGLPPTAGEVGDVRVGMHALDSRSATLLALKPWYRRARITLMPLRYDGVTVRSGPGRRNVTGCLTPLLDGGRFAGMLCTASATPAPKRTPAAARLDGGEHAASAPEAGGSSEPLPDPAEAGTGFGPPTPDDPSRREPVAGVPPPGATTDATVAWGAVPDVAAARDAERAWPASEALYRSIVDLQTEVISRFLPDGTLVFVNEPYCRLFGRQAAELLGRRWHPVAHPDDVPMIEDRLRSMSAEDPVVVIDNRVSVADGGWRWMQFVNRGIYDGEGQLTLVQSVGRDLSPLKRIEAELRDSEERLKMALAGAAQFSWDWNLSAGSVDATAVWAELLGHTDPAAPHDEDDWWGLVHPEDRDECQRRIGAHLAGESAILESEHRLRHAAGHWVWVEARGKVTQRADGGRPSRMVGTLRDITQRRRLHDEGVELVKRIETLIRDATRPAPPDLSVDETLRGLTPREREVLLLVAKGMSSARIGQHLHLSTNTVASHRRNLMAKLDLHSSVEIARFVHEHGLKSDD